jgi:hypothetical protein
LDDLFGEYEDRIKNVTSLSFSSNDVLDFNIKILNNSKRWFYQSMKETLQETRDKFDKWQYDIQKNFDSLKYF